MLFESVGIGISLTLGHGQKEEPLWELSSSSGESIHFAVSYDIVNFVGYRTDHPEKLWILYPEYWCCISYRI